MIEEYEFGKVRVDGKEYRSDVIIYPEGSGSGARVDGSWWRKEGHRLDKADLDEVVKAAPEMLVVGTGYHGCMNVPKETLDFVEQLGIKLFAGPH